MKQIALLSACLALTSSVIAAQAPQLNAPKEQISTLAWTDNFEAAAKQAREQSKPLFVYFTGSDWCPWCMRMDKEILSSPEFASLVGKELIFVKVDFPQYASQDPEVVKQNEALKKKYKITGFPTVVLLDSHLNQIGRLGYERVGGEAFAHKLQQKLKGYFENKSLENKALENKAKNS